MYSPKRTERNDTSRGALTPLVHALKNAQTHATQDFDRFYDNLWSRLTPSNARTKRFIPQYGQEERTSLTPLIERHSLREDLRYEDSFYLDNESIVAETPVLERTETPMSQETIQHSPPRHPRHHYNLQTVASPQKQRSSPHRPMASPHSPKRSTLHQNQSVIMQRLAEERNRMDRLQANVTKIKRQSSYLAEEPHTSIRLEKESNTIHLNKHHSLRLSSHKLATPPQSIKNDKPSWNKRQRSPSIDYSVKRIAVSPTPNKRMAASPNSISDRREQVTLRYRFDSSPKRIASSPSPPSPSNRQGTHTITPRNRFAVSPKRNQIENLPKLRSTEMIRTPDGSIISNRFWKEIHGLNASPRRSTMTPKTNSNTSSWANDDGFWSAESEPMPSTLNNKLLQVAQQEEKQKKQEKEQVANDMQWSHETPMTSKMDMFGDQSPLSQELEEAQKREAILKRNQIPVMNPDLLAQLKSVHRDRFIDDSDSYKFA